MNSLFCFEFASGVCMLVELLGAWQHTRSESCAGYAQCTGLLVPYDTRLPISSSVCCAESEKQEYIDGILEDVEWLGHKPVKVNHLAGPCSSAALIAQFLHPHSWTPWRLVLLVTCVWTDSLVCAILFRAIRCALLHLTRAGIRA